MPEGRADVLTGTAAVETALSDGVPFGSHSYIAGEVATVYADLLAVLAEESVAAKDLSAALDRMDPASRPSVLRDSLLRRTIEDGVCRTVKGIDTIEPAMLDELLAETASELAAGHRTLLNEHARGAPLGPTSDFGYVWVGEPRDQLPGRRFVDEVTKRVPRFRVQGATPDQVESLSRGVRLATRVAPHLASSALSHSFMVVLGEFEAEDQRFNSFTLPGLPGVLILSPHVLSSDTTAAEALFHEAFHLKFLDIDYIHPLFEVGFRQETSPRVTPVWHADDPGRGNWPVDRVLTSMHVYLALTVFLERAAGADVPPGWADAAERSVQCRTRATWLCDAAQPHADHLTDSGRRFIAWIRSQLDGLEAS